MAVPCTCSVTSFAGTTLFTSAAVVAFVAQSITFRWVSTFCHMCHRQLCYRSLGVLQDDVVPRSWCNVPLFLRLCTGVFAYCSTHRTTYSTTHQTDTHSTSTQPLDYTCQSTTTGVSNSERHKYATLWDIRNQHLCGISGESESIRRLHPRWRDHQTGELELHCSLWLHSRRDRSRRIRGEVQAGWPTRNMFDLPTYYHPCRQ